jgi:hypothetical protein
LNVTQRLNQITDVFPSNGYAVKQGGTMTQVPAVMYSREDIFCDTLAFTYRIIRVADGREVYRAISGSGGDQTDTIVVASPSVIGFNLPINTAVGIYAGTNGEFMLDNISPLNGGPFPTIGDYKVEVEYFTKFTGFPNPRYISRESMTRMFSVQQNAAMLISVRPTAEHPIIVTQSLTSMHHPTIV